MTSSVPPQIFCKSTLKQHRLKAFALLKDNDPLVRIVEANLLLRIKDFKRDFHKILTLGFRSGALRDFMPQFSKNSNVISGFPLAPIPYTDFVFDEENLPISSEKFDLIISALHLHTVNDLPGSLIQLYDALKPQGLFIGAFLGGETLKEFRTAFLKAEMFLKNGISARFSPQIDIKQGAALLKRAGFKTPISESHSMTFYYETPFDLCSHLKALSETNSLLRRSKGLTTPRLLKEVFQVYESVNDHFPLTFEVIYMTAWRV
ncbi:MAG: methyltransferase domain-containing protein [Proteobacteria bacterium]|nr:methyltransferase domain-containing protein [Pseudomonadota bacterium]